MSEGQNKPRLTGDAWSLLCEGEVAIGNLKDEVWEKGVSIWKTREQQLGVVISLVRRGWWSTAWCWIWSENVCVAEPLMGEKFIALLWILAKYDLLIFFTALDPLWSFLHQSIRPLLFSFYEGFVFFHVWGYWFVQQNKLWSFEQLGCWFCLKTWILKFFL